MYKSHLLHKGFHDQFTHIHLDCFFLEHVQERKELVLEKTKPRNKILLCSCIQLSLLSNSLQKLGLQTGGRPKDNFHINKIISCEITKR